jgi:CheY-like chemotaxis protein
MNKEQLKKISHEIRTPLNGILAMTDMLMKMTIREEIRENINIIDLSAREIFKVIGKIDKHLESELSRKSDESFLEKSMLYPDAANINPQEQKTETPASENSFSVLVVEDDHINQMIMNKLLKDAGHAVTIAENGQEALWKIKSNHFDIIFMDMMMPMMSGTAASTEIRKLEESSGKIRTPIIAFTANASQEAKNECIAAGMDDYITKPVRTKTILELIDRYVSKKL